MDIVLILENVQQLENYLLNHLYQMMINNLYVNLSVLMVMVDHHIFVVQKIMDIQIKEQQQNHQL